MTEDIRKSDTNNTDNTAALLAFLYTVGYFGIVFLMMLRGIPKDNEGALNQLIGALTIIQTGIIGFYFGGSKANEKTQAANVARSMRSEAVVQEIAKAAPVTAAAAVAAATGTPIPPPVSSAPIQAGTVNVEAQTATLTEVKPKEAP